MTTAVSLFPSPVSLFPLPASRFPLPGDTLFNANATQVQAVTGYDIGEEIYTRTR